MKPQLRKSHKRGPSDIVRLRRFVGNMPARDRWFVALSCALWCSWCGWFELAGQALPAAEPPTPSNSAPDQSNQQSPAAAEPALDPNLPYQAKKRNPVTYQVDFSVVVTPPYHTRRLQVWLPLPTSDAGQEVRSSRLSSFPQEVQPQLATESKFGNRFAYFEFVDPQGAQIIRHQFQVQVWELHWQLDPKQVQAVSHWPASFDRYRRGDRQAVVVDDRFQNLLQEIVPQAAPPAEGLNLVLQWVEENFRYDHSQASLRASAEHGLTHRVGHCSDYHGFCASLGRALGVPTRVTYGINPFPKNSPSHCKLEAYLPPFGWVSFDVSETQRLIDKLKSEPTLDDVERQRLIDLAQQRLLSGFRDNTWFVQTRGTDYDLVPPASGPVPVVRTAYIEADGKPLPEPDPADARQIGYSWMTAHRYTPDRPVRYPFVEWQTLRDETILPATNPSPPLPEPTR